MQYHISQRSLVNHKYVSHEVATSSNRINVLPEQPVPIIPPMVCEYFRYHHQHTGFAGDSLHLDLDQATQQAFSHNRPAP